MSWHCTSCNKDMNEQKFVIGTSVCIECYFKKQNKLIENEIEKKYTFVDAKKRNLYKISYKSGNSNTEFTSKCYLFAVSFREAIDLAEKFVVAAPNGKIKSCKIILENKLFLN